MDEAAQRERRSPSGPCLSTRCAAQANQTLTSDVHTSMSWCGMLEQLAVGDHRHPADARSEGTLEGSSDGNTGRDDSVGDGGGAVRNCARMPPASCAAESTAAAVTAFTAVAATLTSLPLGGFARRQPAAPAEDTRTCSFGHQTSTSDFACAVHIGRRQGAIRQHLSRRAASSVCARATGCDQGR